MYSTTEVRVNFFIDNKAKQFEKAYNGRVSVPIKTGEQDENGRNKYEYETWNARFVGKALEKAKGLKDKARITLTVWSARNPYNAEHKKSFPYILVMEFELSE